jgi:hypothetical protein
VLPLQEMNVSANYRRIAARARPSVRILGSDHHAIIYCADSIIGQ